MSAHLPLPARYYVRLGELLQRDGVDVPALLKSARIRPQALQRPDAMLQLEQVEALIDAACTATGREDLGLDLGRSLKLSAHSILGFGLLSSPTVEHALRLAARFYRLITPTFRMRVARDAAHLEATLTPTLPLSHRALLFHIETTAAALHGAVHELLQDDVPRYQLHLSIPAPPHARRYRELAEAQVHFGWGTAPGVRLRLPSRVAARPPALADPSALQLAEERCAALFRNAAAGGRVSDWVSMMLREASDGMPALTEIAHTLNLSPRTLDRYLRREGAGFRELSLAARHARARDLLAQGRSVTQVAHELGYTDASNFTRAFRRAERVAPSRFKPRA